MMVSCEYYVNMDQNCLFICLFVYCVLSHAHCLYGKCIFDWPCQPVSLLETESHSSDTRVGSCTEKGNAWRDFISLKYSKYTYQIWTSGCTIRFESIDPWGLFKNVTVKYHIFVDLSRVIEKPTNPCAENNGRENPVKVPLEWARLYMCVLYTYTNINI